MIERPKKESVFDVSVLSKRRAIIKGERSQRY
jgi:hypothetical protein